MQRVVLVAGASGGIGRATALLLARSGEHLVLTARGVAGLDQISEACLRAGAASAWVIPGDVTDHLSVQAMLDAVVERFGRVDGVVHTAGVAAYGSFVDIPPETFERVLATNVVGTANMARAVMRQFASQDGGGHVVLVGSLLGKIATPFMSPYITSKWAIHGLVRVLQIEARQTPGVEITLVSPGGVDTPIYRWSASFLGRQGQPPPPVDPPEKVARAIVAALDKSHREVSVGVANPFAVLGFRLFPGLFDVLVTPLMRTFGIDPEPTPAHEGNLFQSQPRPVTSYGDRDAAPVRWIRTAIDKSAALVSRRGQAGFEETPSVDERTAPRPQQSLNGGVAAVERLVAAPPADVWMALADGWLYATWVVGASRTRDVDDRWPDRGSQVHHSFGLWPLVLDDTTEVLASERERLMRLKARGRPLGEAEVEITLTESGEGTTRVSIREDVVRGPGRAVPRRVRQLLIAPRNKEALRRLALLAEGRRTVAGAR